MSRLVGRSLHVLFSTWSNQSFTALVLLLLLVGGHLLQAVGQDGPALAPAGDLPAPELVVPPPPAAGAVFQPAADVAQAADNQPGEVLTRGPIHEAFARPVGEERGAPPLLEKAPPAMIEELPPDEKPQGENILWIPGYWSWDDDRRDYLWVSGTYRDAPPNQTWMAGYWRKQAAGWQWVPGFWMAQQQQQEIEFLPEPPATLEQGPMTPQPSDDHFWVAGNWRNVNNHYAWQAGYWSRCQPDWIWVPAAYNWSPQGYVYTSGYWDYTLAARGVCFAPVYFQQTVLRPTFSYTPSVCLRANFLTVHLWSRPRNCHYYFGDYYGANYLTVGYRPWFQPTIVNRPCYDPLFTYYSWQGNRGDRQWNQLVQQRYDYCLQNNTARPPRTWHDSRNLAQTANIQQAVNNVQVINSPNTAITINNVQNNIVNNNNTVFNNGAGRGGLPFGRNTADLASLQVQNASLAAEVKQVARQQQQLPQAPLKLVNLEPKTREQFAQQGRQVRNLSEQRRQLDLSDLSPAPSSAVTGNPLAGKLAPQGANPINPAIPGVVQNPVQSSLDLTKAQNIGRSSQRMKFDAVKPVVVAKPNVTNPAVTHPAVVNNPVTGQTSNVTGNLNPGNANPLVNKPVLKLDPTNPVNPNPGTNAINPGTMTNNLGEKARTGRPLTPGLQDKLGQRVTGQAPVVVPNNSAPVTNNAVPNVGLNPPKNDVVNPAPATTNPPVVNKPVLKLEPSNPVANPTNVLPQNKPEVPRTGRPLSSDLQEKFRARSQSAPATTTQPAPITINPSNPVNTNPAPVIRSGPLNTNPVLKPQLTTPPALQSAPQQTPPPAVNRSSRTPILNNTPRNNTAPATNPIQSNPLPGKPLQNVIPNLAPQTSAPILKSNPILNSNPVQQQSFNRPVESRSLRPTNPSIAPRVESNAAPAIVNRPIINNPPVLNNRVQNNPTVQPRINTPAITPRVQNIAPATRIQNVAPPVLRNNPPATPATQPARGLNNGGGIRNYQPKK